MASERDAIELVVRCTFIHARSALPTRRRSKSESALRAPIEEKCSISDAVSELRRYVVAKQNQRKDEVSTEASSAKSVDLNEVDTDRECDDGDQQSVATEAGRELENRKEHLMAPAVHLCGFGTDTQWEEKAGESMDRCKKASEEWRTTVMLRDVPIEYTCEKVLKLCDDRGFKGMYDFVYYPIDHNKWNDKGWNGKGYAFINFISSEVAQSFQEALTGFKDWEFSSHKVGRCSWATRHGLEANVRHYQNSDIMHRELPATWKPVLFRQGVQYPFPPPTKSIPRPNWMLLEQLKVWKQP
jgi:hypothetical protein